MQQFFKSLTFFQDRQGLLGMVMAIVTLPAATTVAYIGDYLSDSVKELDLSGFSREACQRINADYASDLPAFEKIQLVKAVLKERKKQAPKPYSYNVINDQGIIRVSLTNLEDGSTITRDCNAPPPMTATSSAASSGVSMNASVDANLDEGGTIDATSELNEVNTTVILHEEFDEPALRADPAWDRLYAAGAEYVLHPSFGGWTSSVEGGLRIYHEPVSTIANSGDLKYEENYYIELPSAEVETGISRNFSQDVSQFPSKASNPCPICTTNSYITTTIKTDLTGLFSFMVKFKYSNSPINDTYANPLRLYVINDSDQVLLKGIINPQYSAVWKHNKKKFRIDASNKSSNNEYRVFIANQYVTEYQSHLIDIISITCEM